MKKIIYIEDKEEHFIAISNLLMEDYIVIPSIDKFKQMELSINNNKIWQFLENKIIENQEDLAAILIDLKLQQNDDVKGEDLIYKIRNELAVPGKYFLSKLIPIIVLTDYAGDDIARNALRNGATHNIPKSLIIEEKDGQIFANDIAHFQSVLESMIRYYNNAYFNRSLDELFEGITSDLEYQKKLIQTGFYDLDIKIKGNTEEILVKFDLLFNFIFASFKTDTQNRIFKNFEDELKNILTPETLEKLNESTWSQIKDAIREINNGGGFKSFVDSTYEILNNADILGDKGKLIGIAIKGIFGILASYR